MRKITASKEPWFREITLKKNKTYQFMQCKHGEKPTPIGPRFQADSWEQHIPDFDKTFIYTIVRIRCIPSTYIIEPSWVHYDFFKGLSNSVACYLLRVLIVICITGILVVTIKKLESESSIKNLLCVLCCLTYIVFEQDLSVPKTAEKIYNIVKRKN